MKDQILDIKQEYYFPFNFKIFGLILMLGTVLSFTIGGISIVKLILLAIFTLLTRIMFTTRYGLLVDVEKSAYMVYTLFLGHKKGKIIKINSIEKLFINEVTSTKSVVRYTTGVPRKFKNQEYKAFMKLDNGIKIHLDTDRSREKLQERVDQYALVLRPVLQ